MTFVISEEDYLAHHGVKGMKWGVRNEDRGGSSKAGSSSQLTPFQKREFERQLGMYVAFRAAKKIAALKSSGELHRKGQQGKAFITRKDPYKHDASLAQKDMSESDIQSKVVKQVNPDWGKSYGAAMNCRRCSFVYEMRRRGYDVQATKTISGRGGDSSGFYNALKVAPGKHLVSDTQSVQGERILIERGLRAVKLRKKAPFADFAKQWGILGENKIVQKPNEDVVDSMFRTLKSQPERSRGDISIGYKIRGAHSMAYEIINGKPVIFDTQSRITYHDSKTFPAQNMIKEAHFTRLDNATLNTDFLLRWAKNV